jgi:hypothetical protein
MRLRPPTGNDPPSNAILEHQPGGEQQKLDEDFLVALEHGTRGGVGSALTASA